MYSFKNDYSEICHPDIAQAIVKYHANQFGAYGDDVHSAAAAELIKKLCGKPDADVHFFVGGTQTNLTVIGAFLRPHHAVIAAHSGHINVHETGAIEATGHKVIAMYEPQGKLNPALIAEALAVHCDEHMVKPKMVYISQSTELGTIYSKAELTAISDCCRANDLYLYLDGARLGSALCAEGNDVSPEDIANLCDAFYIGATKNGGMLGEALVICSGNPLLKEDFRYLLKQRGAMLAKGVVVGLQFEELFKSGLFFTLARHANDMAAIIRGALCECGVPMQADSPTNQLFPIFQNSIIAEIKKDYDITIVEPVDADRTCVRFVTSWATDRAETEKFAERLKALLK